MDDCEYKNDKDDYGDIYNNGDDDYIPYHDYHIEYRSLVGKFSGECISP